jgi:hypothetical protein
LVMNEYRICIYSLLLILENSKPHPINYKYHFSSPHTTVKWL